MNYSANQRTGELGELAVETLFTEWGWTVGKDRIDVGYDHFVEPDRKRFLGARFLVQTKGSSIASRSAHRVAIARVSRARLRDYLSNPIPVVIVRASRNGAMHWLHAQEWCRRFPSKLLGSGDVRVPIPVENRLADREQFEEFLASVLSPPAVRRGSLSDLISARSKYLSKIDPRLSVHVSATESGESYRILQRPSSELVKFDFCLQVPAGQEAGFKNLEAFGLPFDLAVDQLRVSGSPLLSELGLDEPIAGRISIAPMKVVSGRIRLSSGSNALDGQSFSFASNITWGSKGAAFCSTQGPVHARVLLERSGEVINCDAHFSIAEAEIGKVAISGLHELSEFGKWATSALNSSRLWLTLEPSIGSLSTALEVGDSFRQFLEYSELLGRIAALANYSGSEYTFDPKDIEKDDWWATSVAEKMLRGQRVQSRIGRLSVKPSMDPHSLWMPNSHFVMTSTFDIQIGKTPLVSIPVIIGFAGFDQETDADGQIILTANDSSESWMMYRDDRLTLEEQAKGLLA